MVTLVSGVSLFTVSVFPAYASTTIPTIVEASDTTILSTPKIEITTADKALQTKPEVILESLNELGNPEPGTYVTVKDMSDAKKVVFQGRTDENGTVKFTSVASDEFLKKSIGNVADIVYEVFFVVPGGEVTRKVLSVPHIKDPSKVDSFDQKVLEKTRDKKVSVKATKAKDISNKQALSSESTSNIQPLGTVGTCDILMDGYKRCTTAAQDYSVSTKVGSVNVGSGEQVDFNLTSSAKISLAAGYKLDSNPFSPSGSVSLSADTSTSVDYSFGGTCAYFGSTLYCDTARNVYAMYQYHYEQTKLYRYDVLQRTEETVTPIGLVGGSTEYSYTQDSNNARPVSSVIANSYGPYFSVYNKSTGSSSTTKSYKSERTYGLAFTVNTPVGAFQGSATTQYANSHTIKWYVPSVSTTTFYHYDYSTNGGSYYVTH